MKRGFKTWAERQSETLRTELGLTNTCALPARTLAKHLKIPVIDVAALSGLSDAVKSELLGRGSHFWSAVTLPVNGSHVIIFNSSHTPSRQESDLMHELAHIICEHAPAIIETSGRFPWASRTFKIDQEKEAEWFGACLQITRVGLVWAIKRGMPTEAIAEFYGASQQLARFRRNTSGVDKQIERSQKYYRHSGGTTTDPSRFQIQVRTTSKAL